jgi:hypothetical protein
MGEKNRLIGILKMGTSVVLEMVELPHTVKTGEYAVTFEGQKMRSLYTADEAKELATKLCGVSVEEWIAIDEIVRERDEAKAQADGASAMVRSNFARANIAECMIREAYATLDGKLGGDDSLRAMADKVITACHQFAEIVDLLNEEGADAFPEPKIVDAFELSKAVKSMMHQGKADSLRADHWRAKAHGNTCQEQSTLRQLDEMGEEP